MRQQRSRVLRVSMNEGADMWMDHRTGVVYVDAETVTAYQARLLEDALNRAGVTSLAKAS